MARGLVERWCERSAVRLEHPGRAAVVISELTTNVVLHADTVAPFQLVAALADRELVVEVRDRGCGIQATAAAASDGLGRGLQVARAWSVRCVVTSTPEGTSVAVAFALEPGR
jgi:anti-sigma regulatory factor (Ser/Thr protein kinase)